MGRRDAGRPEPIITVETTAGRTEVPANGKGITLGVSDLGSWITRITK